MLIGRATWLLQMHRVVVHTIERRASKPCAWKSKALEFQTAVSSWLLEIAAPRVPNPLQTPHRVALARTQHAPQLMWTRH